MGNEDFRVKSRDSSSNIVKIPAISGNLSLKPCFVVEMLRKSESFQLNMFNLGVQDSNLRFVQIIPVKSNDNFIKLTKY